MTNNGDKPLILHCFADHGAETEALSRYGEVIRVGIDPVDTGNGKVVAADAHVRGENGKDLPFNEGDTFDLGLFHPVCSKWASTTSISGDPDDHVNMIPSARDLADRYCSNYVIENVPRAPLKDPTVLDGRMFGLPIKYERAFETDFNVPQPPRYKRFWGKEENRERAETSSFFFSENSKRWWASVKGVDSEKYDKEHIAKNTIPVPYIHHICRAWLKEYEENIQIDYSDYDERMETERRKEANKSLYEYVSVDE